MTTNPYSSHPSLSTAQADLLYEYANLALIVNKVAKKIHQITAQPDPSMLARLRILEKKMGLVLTLFKASVWGVINEQPHASDTDSLDNI